MKVRRDVLMCSEYCDYCNGLCLYCEVLKSNPDNCNHTVRQRREYPTNKEIQESNTNGMERIT